jgi:predicted DsbA family dithiol-disulfide isomerase
VASAYGRDAATGLAVSSELRAALFELGRDVADPAVLAEIAATHDLPAPPTEAIPAVRADYDSGLARGVKGSPHFFVGSHDFFCPALDLGHDDAGHLTARFDAGMLAEFFASIDA